VREGVRSNNRRLLIVFLVLLALALIGPIIGGTLFGPGGMWEDTDRAAGWALGLLAGFAGLSLLATPAALIVGIVLLVRWLGGTTPLRTQGHSRLRRMRGRVERRRRETRS
jgi:hypothetical protein